MKRCYTCKVLKPLEEFNNHKKSKDGKYHNCKICFRQIQRGYYKTNPARQKKIREVALRNRETNRKWIRQYKVDKGCIDCGYNAHWAALQFDHLRDKEFNVSGMLKYGLTKIKQEIEKCEVVCSNCHSIRTATRREDLAHMM